MGGYGKPGWDWSVLKASDEDIQSLFESGFLDLVKDVVDGALGGIVDRDDGDDVSDCAGAVKHFGNGFLFRRVIAIHRDRGDDIGHKFGGVVERRFAYLEYGDKGQQTVIGFVSVENHIYLVVGLFMLVVEDDLPIFIGSFDQIVK